MESIIYFHLGLSAKRWLPKLCSISFHDAKIVPLWYTSEVKANLKPGKDNNKAENYRPIALLCIRFKLFERNNITEIRA